jgi:hypothetical protein
MYSREREKNRVNIKKGKAHSPRAFNIRSMFAIRPWITRRVDIRDATRLRTPDSLAACWATIGIGVSSSNLSSSGTKYRKFQSHNLLHHPLTPQNIKNRHRANPPIDHTFRETVDAPGEQALALERALHPGIEFAHHGPQHGRKP